MSGRLPDAERVLKAAVEMDARLKGAPNPEDLERLAMLANARRDGEAAHEYLARAVDVARKQVPHNPVLLVRLLIQGAAAEEKQGQAEEALASLQEAQTIAKRVLPTKHPMRLQAISKAGALLSKLDRLEEAAHVLSEALALNRSAGGAGSAAALQALPPLALALHSLGRYAEAEKVVQEGLEASRKSMGERNGFAGFFHLILAASAREQGEFDAADANLAKAKAIIDGLMGPASMQAHLVRWNRAELLVDREQYEEARGLAESCVAFFGSSPPSDSIRRSAELLLVSIYDNLDETEKAAALLKKVLPHQLAALKLPTDRRTAQHEASIALLYPRYKDTYDPKRGLELAHQALESERRAKGVQLWRRYLVLADAQMKNGDEAGARDSLIRAAAQAPKAFKARVAKQSKKILGGPVLTENRSGR